MNTNNQNPQNASNPITNPKGLSRYSIARLILVAAGAGIIIQALRIAANALFHISPSSEWLPFISGFIVVVVAASFFHHFSTGGRDRQLLPKNTK